jgi:hypothetical protein
VTPPTLRKFPAIGLGNPAIRSCPHSPQPAQDRSTTLPTIKDWLRPVRDIESGVQPVPKQNAASLALRIISRSVQNQLSNVKARPVYVPLRLAYKSVEPEPNRKVTGRHAGGIAQIGPPSRKFRTYGYGHCVVPRFSRAVSDAFRRTENLPCRFRPLSNLRPRIGEEARRLVSIEVMTNPSRSRRIPAQRQRLRNPQSGPDRKRW